MMADYAEIELYAARGPRSSHGDITEFDDFVFVRNDMGVKTYKVK